MSKPAQSIESRDLKIKNPTAKISVKINNYAHYVIGTVSSTNSIYTWDTHGESEIEFDVTLDGYLMSEIENIRKGGDLNLVVEILLLANEIGKSYTAEEMQYPLVVGC